MTINKYGVKERILKFDNNSFSERHRKYGMNLICYDTDLTEFKNNQPVIMFELKYGAAIYKEIDLNSTQLKCQSNIANPLKIPLFLLLYFFPGINEANGKVNEFGEYHKYYIIPVNDFAKKKLKEPKYVTEYQLVWFINKIKNEVMQDNLELDNKLDWFPPLLKIKG